MKKIISITIMILSIVSSISPALAADRQELTISAAASLTDALREIKGIFESTHPGTKLYCNFAASGVLAKQIETGAPVDVFISASLKQMDQVDTKELLLKDSRKDLLSNDMVLIVPINSKLGITSFDDLKKKEIKNIAIGNPDFVPAGQYAKEIFKSLKLTDSIADRVIYGEDVRQVLNYVERGEVDAGIVFTTDYMIMQGRLRVAATAPIGSHKPIVYPVAIVKSSKNTALAKEFIDFLSSDEGMKIFKKYGFKNI